MALEPAPHSFVDDGSITVVIPSYNEGENLPQVLEDIAGAFSAISAAVELLVIDDGSSDETSKVLQSLEGGLSVQLRSVRHSRNKGLGVALKTGIGAARSTWVGWLPADGQFSPQDLLRLYQERTGAEASVGRVQVSERRKADSVVRVALSLSLRVIMRLLHPHIPEFNGVMVFKRDLISAPELVCRTGFVNMEILDRIRRTCEGAQVRESVVAVLSRRSGSSKVANWRTIFIVVGDLVRLRLNYLFTRREKRFKPPKHLRYIATGHAASSSS